MVEKTVSGPLTILEVNARWTELEGLQGQPLRLDLGQVDELDTAGLQLLIALKLKARMRGTRLEYTNHSLPVLRVLSLTGAAGILGDKLRIPSGMRAELPFAYGARRGS